MEGWSGQALRSWLVAALAVLLLLTGCVEQAPLKGAAPGAAGSGAGSGVPDDGVHPEAISRTEVFWFGDAQVELTVYVGPVVRSRSSGALPLRFEVTGGQAGAGVELVDLLGTPDGDSVDARLLDAGDLRVYEPMRLEGSTPLTRFLDDAHVQAGGGAARWVGYFPMPRGHEGPMHVLLPYFGLVEGVHVDEGRLADVPGMEELLTDQIMTSEDFPLEQHSEPVDGGTEPPGVVGEYGDTVEVADPEGRHGSAAVRVEEVRRVGGVLVGRIFVQQAGDEGAPHGAGWAVHAGWASDASRNDSAEPDAEDAPDAVPMRAADAPTLLVDGERVFPLAYNIAGRPEETQYMPLTDRMFGYEDLRGEGRSATATVIWPDVGGEVVTVDMPTSDAADVEATGSAQPFRFTDVPVLTDASDL